MKFIYLFLTLYAFKAAYAFNHVQGDSKELRSLSELFHYDIGGSPEKLITAVITHRDQYIATETLQVVYFHEETTFTGGVWILDKANTHFRPTKTMTETIETEITAPASDFYLKNGDYYLIEEKLSEIASYAYITASPL